jgi:hypothetical protein
MAHSSMSYDELNTGTVHEANVRDIESLPSVQSVMASVSGDGRP